jgi:hypothetical protein
VRHTECIGTLEKFEFELQNVVHVASVPPTKFLIHHTTNVIPIEDQPLFTSRNPLLYFITVNGVGIWLITGWFSEVYEIAILFADLFHEFGADGGFPDTIGA